MGFSFFILNFLILNWFLIILTIQYVFSQKFFYKIRFWIQIILQALFILYHLLFLVWESFNLLFTMVKIIKINFYLNFQLYISPRITISYLLSFLLFILDFKILIFLFKLRIINYFTKVLLFLIFDCYLFTKI
jgi:hypothetical protein